MPLFLRSRWLCALTASACIYSGYDSFAQGYIDEDPRWQYPHFLGFRPADAQSVDVNPPRFSWPYRPGIVGATNETLKKFTFQVDDDSGFGSPAVDVVVDYNFYNTLAPLAAGTWYWRVGYDNDANGSVDAWSATKSFILSGSETQWDRTAHGTAESTLAGMSRPRFGPAGGNWAAFKTFLESTSRGQVWLSDLRNQADSYVGQDWYANTAYFPITDKDESDGTYDSQVTFSTPGGNVSWGTNDFGRYCQNAVVVAFAHKITGDAAYAGAKEVLLRFANFTHSNSSLSWPEYNGGTTKQSVCITEYLALVYDWYYSDLSGSERSLLIDRVSQRVEQVYTTSRSWRSSADAYHEGIGIVGNSHPYQNFMWALPGLLLMTGEDTNMDNLDLVPFALDFLTGVTASSLYGPDDGAITEGPGYGSEKQGSMLKTAIMAEMMLGLEQEKNPFMSGYQEWHSHIMPPGYDRIPFGDQWSWDIDAGPNQKLLTLLTGNSKAKQRWEQHVNEEGESLDLSTFSRPWTVMLALQRLSANAAVSPQAEDKNVVFEESGWVMAGSHMPTSASDFDSGVRMTFQSRPRGGRSHSYRSENAFAWYAYGESLAAGGGSRRYPDSYSRHTMSHNAVLINGLGQEWDSENNPAEPYVGRLLAYEEGTFGGSGSYTHWVGDATKAYRTLSGAGLKRWHRHVILVDEKYFIIYDDLQMNDGAHPATFSWLMSVDKDVPVTTGGNDFTWTQGSVNARVFFARDSSDLNITKQYGHEEVYKNLQTGDNMLPDVEQEFTNRNRDYWSEYISSERTYNKLWVENQQANTRWQLMSALLAWPTGSTAPGISRVDDRTLEITFDGQTRKISFDPTQTGDYIVDLNGYRAHAGEAIPTEPTVTATRSVEQVAENSGETNYFYITRSDKYDTDVTVNYTISGSATAGSDHSLGASGSVVIPVDESLVAIPFTMSDDVFVEPDETITLTIAADPAYNIGQASADVEILDDDTINLFAVDEVVGLNSTTEIRFNITNTSSSAQSYTLAAESSGDGYKWNSSEDDNSQTIVPDFDWVDLKEFNGAGTATFSASDDGETGALNIGFDFPYYDGSSSTIVVNTNGFGYVGASNGSTWDYTNQALPYGGVDKGSIFPLWDDLMFVDGSQLYYANTDNDTFIMQWDNVGFFGRPASQRVTFQAVLYSDGSIQYNYKDINPTPGSNFSYTIGIQDFNNSEALQVAHFGRNNDGDFIPKGSDVNFAVRIWRPADFLSLSQSSFTLGSGESKEVTLILDSQDLQEGEYINNLTISGSNDGQIRNIPVAMEISETEAQKSPSRVDANYSGLSDVNLTWPDADAETGYCVRMQRDGDSRWITLAENLAADSTSFLISGMSPGQTYEFSVSALDGSVARSGATTFWSALPGGSGYDQGAASPHLVMVEAENYTSTETNGAPTAWTSTTAFPGYSGTSAMQASPDAVPGVNYTSNIENSAPVLNFDIRFSQTGTHYLFIHCREPGEATLNGSDSLHAGLNGVLSPGGEYIEATTSGSGIGINWGWANTLVGRVTRITLNVPSVDVHTVNIWPREDGIIVDKILLTTSESYLPSGSELESTFVSPPVYSPLEIWRQTHFGTAMGSGDVVDNVALANDGMANLMKFALGGTPWTEATILIPTHQMTPVSNEDYLEFTYRRREGSGSGTTESGYTVDGVTYTVEVRESLSAGAWQTGASLLQEQSVSSNGDGTDDITVRRVEPVSDSDSAFIRLRVE